MQAQPPISTSPRVSLQSAVFFEYAADRVADRASQQSFDHAADRASQQLDTLR